MNEAKVSKLLMSKAGRILSRRAHSRGELKRKLARYADAGFIEAVLHRLEELNVLNDAEYAYNFALRRMRHDGWGPVKVLHSLRGQDISPDLAKEVIGRVCSEASELELLQEYLKRHCSKTGFPRDRKGLQKLASHLRRRGFREERIVAALRQLPRNASWQLFETGE